MPCPSFIVKKGNPLGIGLMITIDGFFVLLAPRSSTFLYTDFIWLIFLPVNILWVSWCMTTLAPFTGTRIPGDPFGHLPWKSLVRGQGTARVCLDYLQLFLPLPMTWKRSWSPQVLCGFASTGTLSSANMWRTVVAYRIAGWDWEMMGDVSADMFVLEKVVSCL